MVAPGGGTMMSLLRAYQESGEFRDKLAERTKRDYAGKIRLIERKFGDFPLAALADPRTRDVFLTWRDSLPGKSRRQSDYTITVLAAVLSWGLERRKIKVNPLVNPGRMYSGSRRDKIWTYDDEAAFLELAPAHMHLPFMLAIWTAQRQGDLLRLTWTAYDGKWIRLRQSKTGTHVAVPVGKPLKIALDAAAKVKKSPLILVNSDNQPWTSDGFRSSWRKACAKAGVKGLTFHDLRGSAVTRLALGEASEAEIAIYSGLSLADVRAILDRHYLSRDPALAESAVRKLEAAVHKLETGTKSTK